MPAKRTIVAFWAFFLFCVPSYAAWTFAGWYGAGCYPAVEWDANVADRVYLTSDVAGIWRSDDAGEHWTFATKGLENLHVPVLALAPSDPNVLYAGTASGLYVSRDASAHWRLSGGPGRKFRFQRPESHRSLLVSVKDPAKILAGTADGEVWSSEDLGDHWRSLGKPFHKTAVITAMAWALGEGRFYAASSQGLAVYSFSGGSWEILTASPTNISDIKVGPATGKIYAAGNKKLYLSEDEGRSWRSGEPIPKGSLYRIELGDGAKKIIAAWNDDWKGGMAVSEDDGSSWRDLDKTMTKDEKRDPTRSWAGVHGRINSIRVDPKDPRRLLRTDWWGVWKSEDGGVSWTEKINGAPNTVTSDIAIAENGDIYVATMDNGLLKSTDSGGNYHMVFPKDTYKDDENGHVWRVLLRGNDRVIATSSPWNRDLNQVVVSDGEGNDLKKFRAGLPSKRPKKNTVWQSGYIRALAAHPTEEDKLFLGADGDEGGGFYVSEDGGGHWHRPRNQPGSLKIYNGLAVDPLHPNIIYWGATGSRGGVYVTEDGGESWSYSNRRMKKVFDIAVRSDGYVVAGGELRGPALFGSGDHGKSWKLLKQFGPQGTVEGLCFLPDGRLALGVMRWHYLTGGGYYLGSPDFKTWRRLDDESLPDGEGPAAIAYHPKENALYVARYAGSVYKYDLASQDGASHD